MDSRQLFSSINKTKETIKQANKQTNVITEAPLNLNQFLPFSSLLFFFSRSSLHNLFLSISPISLLYPRLPIYPFLPFSLLCPSPPLFTTLTFPFFSLHFCLLFLSLYTPFPSLLFTFLPFLPAPP